MTNNNKMTLGECRKIALFLSDGDENNNAVKFFDEKIKVQGEDEIVIAHESQIMYLIYNLLK
jgi:hypothetical protein